MMGDAVSKLVKIGTLGVVDLEPPKMPGIPKTEVMPLADEAALAAARRRQAAKKGSGRASTVLTGGSSLGSTGAGKKTVGG
jgi:hypothetical protein